MEVSYKTKNRVIIWCSNPTPGHISGKDKNSNLKRYMHPNVHCSTVYNSQNMEATQLSIDRWMDKEDVLYIYIYIHTHNGILLSHKKSEILSFATTWMDVEITILSEISQRKTNIIWYHLYVESKKNDTNELIYKTELDSQT